MVNKVILIGNLGRDPEVRTTPNGQTVASFTLATSRKWKDKDGQRQEQTEWHNIVVWDRLAEICNQYLTKGRMVYTEGSLQTREWDDKEGVKRKTTEVRARDMVMLGGGPGGESSGSSRSEFAAASASGNGSTITDDDIPF